MDLIYSFLSLDYVVLFMVTGIPRDVILTRKHFGTCENLYAENGEVYL